MVNNENEISSPNRPTVVNLVVQPFLLGFQQSCRWSLAIEFSLCAIEATQLCFPFRAYKTV